MTTDLNKLVTEAIELGAKFAAIADSSKLIFHEDFRKACERNACGKYNTNWMGPPAIGPISELKVRAGKYKQGLLFQTVYQLKNSFDLKGMQEGGRIHEAVFRRILEHVKEKYFQDILPLNAGCCSICPKCAYLDGQPCRHPDQAVASVEAYGIDVMALEKECGVPYYNGKDTISYVGLILFH